MKDIVTAAARIAKKRLGMINLLAKVYIRESDEENHGDLNAIERDFIELAEEFMTISDFLDMLTSGEETEDDEDDDEGEAAQ